MLKRLNDNKENRGDRLPGTKPSKKARGKVVGTQSEDGEQNNQAKNSDEKVPTWLRIVLAAIPVIGVILVGYWQFLYKPLQQDSKKELPYTGRVRDDKTTKPIHNAKVSIEEDQRVPQVRLTDVDGIFHVNLPDSTKAARIIVEAEGYRLFDRNISLSRTGIEDVRLTPNDIMIPNPPLPSTSTRIKNTELRKHRNSTRPIVIQEKAERTPPGG